MEIRQVIDNIAIYSEPLTLWIALPQYLGSAVFAQKVERICTAYAGLSSNLESLSNLSKTIKMTCLSGIRTKEEKNDIQNK